MFLFDCSIGIISLTKVSSRDAGIACGAWMFIYGMLGKVGAFFTSIPQPVLGGMSSKYYKMGTSLFIIFT